MTTATRPGLLARLRRLALILVLAGPALLAFPPNVSAADAQVTGSSSDEGWGVKRVLRHFRTRSGVVHLCIIAVAAALYVMMRKLTESNAGERGVLTPWLTKPGVCTPRSPGVPGTGDLDGEAP